MMKTIHIHTKYTTNRNVNTQSLQYTASQGRTKLTVTERGISHNPMKEARMAHQKQQRHYPNCPTVSLASQAVRLYIQLETWANAQRDGRPAEYWWRPLFNAAVWLTPTTRVPCSNAAAKMRNPLKLPGVPQTNERISAASGPKFTIGYCGDM